MPCEFYKNCDSIHLKSYNSGLFTLQIDASKLLPFFAFKLPEFSKRGSKHTESDVIDLKSWQFQEEASLNEAYMSTFQCLSMGSKRAYLHSTKQTKNNIKKGKSISLTNSKNYHFNLDLLAALL